MERTKLGLSKDKMYKALGEGERTSKKVSSIRMSDGSTFKRKNANQYGTAEGGNDYTEKRSNRTDRFDLGGTADSSNTGANIGGTMGSSVMKKGGGVGANESMFSKGDVIFYFKGKKANDFYKGLSNLMPDHEITMVNDDKVQAFFGNYSDLEDAMQMAKTYGMTYQGKYKNGGGVIEEGDIVLVKSSKLKGEVRNKGTDFVTIEYIGKRPLGGDKRGTFKLNELKLVSEYANGGGLSDLPENPNNDAISYKDGGATIKGISKKIKDKIIDVIYTDYNNGNIEEKEKDLMAIFKEANIPYSREKVKDVFYKEYKSRGGYKPFNEYTSWIFESKYANGGGLANTPESFPNNDAVSYKTGGKVIKSKQKLTGDDLDTYNFFIREGDTEEQAMQGVLNARKDRKEHKENESFYKRGYEHAEGGTTKGFEYTIGGL